MVEEKNQTEGTQRKIELQVIPCPDKMARQKGSSDSQNPGFTHQINNS